MGAQTELSGMMGSPILDSWDKPVSQNTTFDSSVLYSILIAKER